MNKLVLLALLAGASSVELDRRHRQRHYVRKPVFRRRADSLAQRPFAEGMGEDEKVGEIIRISDNDVIYVTPNGDGGAVLLPVSVPQKHPHADLVGPARTNAKPFADGMDQGEKVGEVLRVNDMDVVVGLENEGYGAFPLPVYVPQKNKPFAEGMGEDEKVGEVLQIKDNDVIYVPPNGAGGAIPLPVSVPQKKKPFAEGMGEDEKVGEVLQIKDNDVIYVPPNGAGGAIPLPVSVPQKNSSFAQFSGRPIGQVASQHMWRQRQGDEYLMTSVDPGSGFPNTLADAGGPLLGRPGLPTQSTVFAAPEKEWQQWAQDFVDWEDNQTDMANTRLPYASTLLQLEDYHHMPNAQTDPGVAVVDHILAETSLDNGETEKVEDDMVDLSLVQTE